MTDGWRELHLWNKKEIYYPGLYRTGTEVIQSQVYSVSHYLQTLDDLHAPESKIGVALKRKLSPGTSQCFS